VAGYKKIDWGRITREWNILADGICAVMEILEHEKVFDAARLPSYPPLPVIAAIWEYRGKHDAEGYARGLLRQYLWRSFLTARYNRSTQTNAVQDFRALRKVLTEKTDPATVPALNESLHPLPDIDAIAVAGWPKEKNILGRALMILQLQCGAQDLADACVVSASHVRSREYHHLFPAATLESAGLDDDAIWRAVNCALISWATNRKISDQDPLDYLKRRTDHALNGEADIRSRLRTHLVEFSGLNVGGYATLVEPDRSAKVRRDYEAFCTTRARILHIAAAKAAHGQLVTADSVLTEYERSALTKTV
jgi:hypothetical protein